MEQIMFELLFKKRIHSKPVNSSEPDEQYIVREFNILQNFADDFSRYGLITALDNFLYLISNP